MGNFLSSAFVSRQGNDTDLHSFYYGNMAKTPRHDWYFKEWLHTLQLKQSDIVAAADWPKSKVSKLVHGDVAYNRDIINEAADAMHLRPFELLMHPDDAMAIRRMRESAVQIAAEERSTFRDGPVIKPFDLGKDGTNG